MNVTVHASNHLSERANCAHKNTRFEQLPPGEVHYGRIVCSDCGRQLCWQPHPRNVELRQRNASNIRKLLDNGRLTEWERDYCQGISKQSRLSPRQQALLNSLTEKHLQGENVDAHTKRNGAAL